MNINIVIGFFIFINIVGISLMWLKTNTEIIKLKESMLNVVFIIIASAGGFIGVLLGNEMLNYSPKSKIFKRLITFILFIELGIIIFIEYKKNY